MDMRREPKLREPDFEQQLDDAVAAVWERRRDQVMDRVGVLVGAIESLRGSAATESMSSVVAEARDEAHRLAGSLGSFGFDEASETAARIEEALSQSVSRQEWSEWVNRLEMEVIALKTYMDAR